MLKGILKYVAKFKILNFLLVDKSTSYMEKRTELFVTIISHQVDNIP